MKKIIKNKLYLYLILIILSLFSGSQTYALTSTISYAGIATDIGGGNYSWINTSNATGNTTGTFAQSTVPIRNRNTNYLSLTNFNLSSAGIPSGATINGIQTDVEWVVSGNRMRDLSVQLTKDGTTAVGNNNGNNANGPLAKTITTYGSALDLWGTTWNTTELFSSNFGVILQYRNKKNQSRDVNVYRVSITIDYTNPPATPGGVSSGLQLWLKADAGTSTTTDGNSLTTWSDQSINNLDAGGGVSPAFRDNVTDNLNYNPVVDFDGTTQYLENLSNGAYSQSYFAVIVPDNTVDGTLSGQVPFGIDCNSGILNTGTCGLTFAGLTLGAFTVAINDEVITHAIGSSTGWRSAQIGTASYQASKPMLINMNENALGNGTEISEKGVLLDNYNANTYQTLSSADYRIGMSTDGNYPFPYNGKIAEIIDYNSRISISDKAKIESYLSLKYGITLQDGTQNYVASDGSTSIWNTTSAGTYINDIFGIGRDDDSELGQVKSKSVNDDNVITLEAVGEGTNSVNSFVDIADKEFLSISNNNGGNTWTATDAPATYSVLSRYWRVQETGEVGSVNIDFDVGNLNFDIPTPSIGIDYYFIYDSNNNNLLSDETPQLMTNTTGSIWRIAGVDLNNTREFSIATQASTNNIPTDITLSNNTINENVANGTTIGTLSTTDADLGDTHTYSFVAGFGDEDNGSFTIVGNSINIDYSPDYELKNSYNVRIQTDDGNGGLYQKAFIIYINNIGEAVNSIIDFEDLGDEEKYSVTSGNWTRTLTNPNEGIYSLESDNGGANNTQSCFEVTNTFSGTGTINFDYNVSSQAGDELVFYIDNIQQQSWSGTVPWATYTDAAIIAGIHTYKWCYIKDAGGSAGTDNAFIDYITFSDSSGDIISPIISSINYASGSLLPGGNHNIIINYSDLDSGIDTNSDNISLNKWNGSIWGADISATGFNLGSKTITTTQATYPTNNLDYGKYRYNFDISDNSANLSSTGAVFYIDEPEIIISTGSLDIGNISTGSDYFSANEIIITVKTVGAGFNVILNKSGNVVYSIFEIVDYNGITGVGYDVEAYTSTIHKINSNEIIATQSGSINTNGNKNTYIYRMRMGAAVGEEQAAGDYSGNIDFTLDMNY